MKVPGAFADRVQNRIDGLSFTSGRRSASKFTVTMWARFVSPAIAMPAPRRTALLAPSAARSHWLRTA
ncbi:hypothetical protein D3C86_2000080 [compost metagenome]